MYFMFCYMFLTHEKHQKTQFLSNFMIFRNSWLFSELFGYFLTQRYQKWFFWHKIRILQMILDYKDILNISLGELGIKNAILVIQPTTVHWGPFQGVFPQDIIDGLQCNLFSYQAPKMGKFVVSLIELIYKFLPPFFSLKK